MKIVIVSTYPKQGSKNIGDQLITNCLCEAISQFCDVSIDIVWRADNWSNVKNKILNADHIFFACLAIRPYMHRVEYPYLNEILQIDIPFSAIAAGTNLPVASLDKNLFANFSTGTLKLLHKFNSVAKVFTTRGSLTQEFCFRTGLDKALFNGDIAFFDKRFENRLFESEREIKNIFISDPHNEAAYINSLNTLCKKLPTIFPMAKLTIVLHGINHVVFDYARDNGIDYIELYKNKDDGLDAYDEADLHVGYRVHGHVSALKRRIYSYLLEQDGRGCDYGMTISKKLSIPNYAFKRDKISLENFIRLVKNKPLNKVSKAPADEMIALIRKDFADGFSKFIGLEKEIENFNKQTLKSIKKVFNN